MQHDPIWKAFTQTGDPLYYLLYCSAQQRMSDFYDNKRESETAAVKQMTAAL